MKHLIALARKYMQRQRFRTILSFACITLSVFVFNLFCMAALLIRGVVLGELTDGWGYWHMDISSWLGKMPEPDRAYDILPNHAAIDDYMIVTQRIIGEEYGSMEHGEYFFLDVSVNDTSLHLAFVDQRMTGGEASINARTLGVNVVGKEYTKLEADEIILPIYFYEQGFREGDVVQITITPNRAKLVADTPAVREIIETLIAEHPEKADLPWFSDSPGAEETGESITGRTLIAFLWEEHLLDTAEYTDAVSGTPYSVSMRIVGFNKWIGNEKINSGMLDVYTSLRSNLNLDTVLQGEFSPTEDPLLKDTTYRNAFISVTDKIDFDDAAEMIYRDLGLPEKTMQEMVHPVGAMGDSLYNREVLALEFRGMDAITFWMTEFCPVLVTLIVLTLVFWALMRFVIDNAFEISVQERSAQFATLRIMGASRRQIALLVCMEAMAYSAAAIPLGVLAAYGCKRMIISAMEKISVPIMETSMPLVTGIGIVLALAAIFISAYTSSMWAARAYAPLEATKRSDLKGNKRETIWNKNLFGKTRAQKQTDKLARRQRQSGDLKTPRKSKLNRKRRGFLFHYTMRNIRRTRKRFLISVITMTLGCGLFSFGISTGGFLFMEFMLDDNLVYEDFRIIQYAFSNELLNEIETKFGNNPNFSECRTNTFFYGEFEWDNYEAGVNALLPEEFSQRRGDVFHVPIYVFPRRDYERDYQKLTGITYDAFVASGSGILCYSAYGAGDAYGWVDTDTQMRYQTGYTAATGEAPVMRDQQGDDISICGAVCVEDQTQTVCILLPAESAEAVLHQYLSTYQTTGSQWYVHTEIALNVASAEKYEAAKDEIQAFLNDTLSRYSGETQFEDGFAENTGLKYVFSAIGMICLIALLAVWGVGIFTMLNTINTGVLNRCNELMTLRMIGMSQMQMRRTVSLESIVYCSISTVIGGILGIAACIYLINRTVFHEYPVAAFGILFAALLLTLLVNILIARVAAHPGLRALHQRLEAGKMMQ